MKDEDEKASVEGFLCTESLECCELCVSVPGSCSCSEEKTYRGWAHTDWTHCLNSLMCLNIASEEEVRDPRVAARSKAAYPTKAYLDTLKREDEEETKASDILADLFFLFLRTWQAFGEAAKKPAAKARPAPARSSQQGPCAEEVPFPPPMPRSTEKEPKVEPGEPSEPLPNPREPEPSEPAPLPKRSGAPGSESVPVPKPSGPSAIWWRRQEVSLRCKHMEA